MLCAVETREADDHALPLPHRQVRVGVLAAVSVQRIEIRRLPQVLEQRIHFIYEQAKCMFSNDGVDRVDGCGYQGELRPGGTDWGRDLARAEKAGAGVAGLRRSTSSEFNIDFMELGSGACSVPDCENRVARLW